MDALLDTAPGGGRGSVALDPVDQWGDMRDPATEAIDIVEPMPAAYLPPVQRKQALIQSERQVDEAFEAYAKQFRHR